jgi:hypothetical protein
MQSHRSLYWFNDRFPFFGFGPRKTIHDILNYRFFLFYCIISVPFCGATTPSHAFFSWPNAMSLYIHD